MDINLVRIDGSAVYIATGAMPQDPMQYVSLSTGIFVENVVLSHVLQQQVLELVKHPEMIHDFEVQSTASCAFHYYGNDIIEASHNIRDTFRSTAKVCKKGTSISITYRDKVIFDVSQCQ